MFRYIYLLIILHSTCTFAIDTINISKSSRKLVPIAINKFDADNAGDNNLANDIVAVITNDLNNSASFSTISPAAFIERRIGIDHKPLFDAWTQINVDLLLNGRVKKVSSTKVLASFILWDNRLKKELIAEEIEVPHLMWRKMAHKIADKIYEKITGSAGFFNTKIVYIAETGTALKRVKKIAMMDYDGANHKYLTDGKHLVLTPRLSPKNDKIAFVSYIQQRPQVYIRDFRSHRDHLASHSLGASFSPSFANHDDDKMLLCVPKNGATHIHELNLRTKRSTQLTQGTSINVSPTYSLDGTKILFNSDRSGSPQLYTMNADGSNVRRISFNSGQYTAPFWSPAGDDIVFIKKTQDQGFIVGGMESSGKRERVVSKGYLVESPSWAFNGRMIMFTKSEKSKGNVAGRTRIRIADSAGINEIEIETPGDASDPYWSRPLK